MQSTTFPKPTEEFWWPSPEAFDDLSIEISDEEDGGATIYFLAPDDTECADWLNYFVETKERKAAFEQAILESLIDQITMQENGKTQELTDRQQNREQA